MLNQINRRFAGIYLAPDKAASAGGEAAPATRGVTISERQSRSANERDLSPKTESIVPSLADITGHLNTGGIKFGTAAPNKSNQQEATGETEEEPTVDEAEQAEESNGEESEEENHQEQEESESSEESTQTGEETEEEQEQEEEQAGEESEESEEPTETDEKIKKLPKEVQTSINARIGELTREKHQLKGELETLRTEHHALQQQLLTQPIRIESPAIPLADVSTVAELNQRAQQAQNVKMWAIENAEGAEVVVDDKTGETRVYEAAEVRKILANAERELAAIPQRQQFLAQKEQADAISRKAYAAAYKPGTQMNQALQSVKRALPWLATLPDADLIICDAMAGKALRDKAVANRTQQAAAIRKVAPVHRAPVPKPAPKVPAKSLANRDAASAVVKQGGTQKSLQQFAESLI